MNRREYFSIIFSSHIIYSFRKKLQNVKSSSARSVLSFTLIFIVLQTSESFRNQIASNSLLLELPVTLLISTSLHDNRNKFGYRPGVAAGCRLLAIVGPSTVVHKPRGISSKSRREFRVCRGGERQRRKKLERRRGSPRWRGTLLEVLRNKLRAFRETFRRKVPPLPGGV